MAAERVNEIEERLLDASLEVVTGDRKTALAARIVEAARKLEQERAVTAPAGRVRRWLWLEAAAAAALVALCVSLIVLQKPAGTENIAANNSTVVLPDDVPKETPAADADSGPSRSVTVGGIGEIQRLDAATRNLRIIDPTDEMLAALAAPLSGAPRVAGLERIEFLGPQAHCFRGPNEKLTAAGLAYLRRFSRLRILDLTPCTRLDDAGLAEVAHLASLEELKFKVKASFRELPRISDTGVARIAALPRLRTLHLLNCDDWISPDALRAIAKSASLRELAVRADAAGAAELTAMKQLEILRLEYSKEIDNALPYVGKIASLRTLHLPSSAGNKALQALSGLSNLQTLDLGGSCEVTDHGLKQLHALKSLRHLNLGSCYGVTDAGVVALLENLPLESLIVSAHTHHLDGDQNYTLVGEATLAAAGASKSLKKLDFGNRDTVNDAGLEKLAASKTLASLDLGHCENLTGAGLKRLAGIATLEELRLPSCYAATDAVLESFTALKKLRVLDLSGVTRAKNSKDREQLGDDGMRHLAALPALEVLNLKWRWNITEKGLEHLSGSPSLKRLTLDEIAGLNSEGLKYLAKIKTLQWVSLYDMRDKAKISDADLRALADALPGCVIVAPDGKVLDRDAPDKGARVLRRDDKDVPIIETLDDVALLPPETTAVRGTGQMFGSRLGRAEIEALVKRCPGLADLNLTFSRVKDDAVAPLAGLKQLRRLDLSNCWSLTTAGLAHIGKIISLEVLRVGSSSESVELGDDGVAQLATLANLRELDLGMCHKITDVGLGKIAGLKNLERLVISYNTNIGDEGYRVIAGFENLRELIHDGGGRAQEVGDSGLKSLAALKHLRVLRVACCPAITDEGVRALTTLAALEELSLQACANIGDGAMAAVAKLPRLQKLDIQSCLRIGEAGFEALSRSPSLQSLMTASRYAASMTDRCLEHLSRIKTLARLTLQFSPEITARGVAHLASLPALEKLNLSDCDSVDDTALAEIAKIKSLRSLTLRSNDSITDAGIKHLHALGTLEDLNLNFCHKLTGAGLKELVRALPNCRISR